MNYQRQQAERRGRQQQAAVARARAAAARDAERARRSSELARAAAARASVADRQAAAKQAAEMHAEARLSEVAAMNADLANTLADIDRLLATTLEVDDFVDLEALKVTSVEHPPFEVGDLGSPTPDPPGLVYSPQPVYREPPAVSGISAALGGKKKHEEAVARARADYDAACRRWHEDATAVHAAYLIKHEEREQMERARLAKIVEAQRVYQEECRQREADAELQNSQLAKLINDLAFDVESAIEEYVDIVLANSVYPDAFPVDHDHRFDLGTRELTLKVTVPEATHIPTVKEYRYVKAKDEITSTALPVKTQKDRYANAVMQIAVRTLHEIFEADRAGRIHSISLIVGVQRNAPTTGRPETVPLVVVAADRDTFMGFDLAHVVPMAMLTHLGAALSKSPHDLTPADTSHGVRGRAPA
jgi:restriction system protein